ncbi:MAG: Xaa-Pro peptidase family protein [Gammaproteobacteria bacterium]|nr:Xaa-Pro peptidase family protein [Gammaproteobacteria bacterium]
MLEEARLRTTRFQHSMAEHGIDIVLLTDESSIAYFAGFWGYLGVEFGRPTFLVLKRDEPPTAITPLMESEMVGGMTWVDRVLPWEDEGDNRWDRVLRRAIGEAPAAIHVERPVLPGLVRDLLDEHYAGTALQDISPLLGRQRAVKSALEISVMKQAGRIGRAMMDAARDGLGEGVREYEVALAVLDAGTRAAASFLTDAGWEAYVSPVIHNLQIMQSGRDTAMVHRRAGMKVLERGDPVYFCFCNLLEFKHYRLGFDRVFHIREASPDTVRVQETAIDAQRAALSAIRAGVRASDAAAAANEVYRSRGFEPGYRTGRSIGMAYLESPELKEGDHTTLEAGMTFAVDGGVTVPGTVGGRIGDSIVVTADGYEFITDYPREIIVVP